jgi:hypothetical protein
MKLLIFTAFIFFSSGYCHAQYKPGYFISKDKSIHYGLIRQNLGNKPSISFKETKKQKAVEYTPDDIPGFVIEQDSFVVLRNFNFQFGFSLIPVTADFVKVLQTGDVSLYVHYGSVTMYRQYTVYDYGPISNYILKKKNNYELKVVPNKEKEFKKEMSAYFSDVETLKTAIEQKKLTYNSIPAIVQAYNRSKNR